LKIALPGGASVRLIVRNEDTILIDQPVKPEAENSWNARNPLDGWVSLILDSTKLPDPGVEFALSATYTGTKGLSHMPARAA
jgi:hypothetical protein